MGNGVRLYIFDIGGVLSRQIHVGPPLSRFLGISLEAFREAMAPLLKRLSIGDMGVMDAWREFSARAGVEVGEDLWNRFFDPALDVEMAALIGELRGGARVVAGTNTIEPHYAFHRDRGDYALFDEVYASCRLGLAKPDPAFYRAILSAEGCRPQEAVFVDDLPENVAGARQVGLRAFLHRDAATLRRELAGAG